MSRSFLSYSLAFAAAALVGGFSATAQAAPAVKPVTAKSHAGRKLLVPPPPPEIPLIGGHSTDEHLLSTLGVPLDYMSKSDLQNMETRLSAAEQKLQEEKAEQDRSLADKKDRAQKFEDLFKEGVVSRRELETARKELSEAQDSQPDIDQRLKDVQTDLARVRKQLDVVSKREEKKTAAAPSKTRSKTTATAVKPKAIAHQ